MFMPGVWKIWQETRPKTRSRQYSILKLNLPPSLSFRRPLFSPFQRRHPGTATELAIEIGLCLKTDLEHNFSHRLFGLGKQITGLRDPERIDILRNVFARGLVDRDRNLPSRNANSARQPI